MSILPFYNMIKEIFEVYNYPNLPFTQSRFIEKIKVLSIVCYTANHIPGNKSQ